MGVERLDGLRMLEALPVDYRNENVIESACESFEETIALKVSQLRRYVKKGLNSALTGQYIEELVRGFVANWIGHRQLLSGTFWSREFDESGEKPLQIDGIVYDPASGPPILREGGFVVAHPVFCTSVIEIKTTHVGKMSELEKRLALISSRYMHHLTASHVMGIVIADPDPAKTSTREDAKGNPSYLYNYSTVGWCPIFILFKETDSEYEPYRPAIDAMIRAIYKAQIPLPNHL